MLDGYDHRVRMLRDIDVLRERGGGRDAGTKREQCTDELLVHGYNDELMFEMMGAARCVPELFRVGSVAHSRIFAVEALRGALRNRRWRQRGPKRALR